MMNKFLISLSVLILLFACSKNEKQETEELKVITVDQFNTDVVKLVGKPVLVQGMVIHVCKVSGKKVQIIGADSSKFVLVTAGEKIPKFEQELNGSDVFITGVVAEERIDEAYVANWEAEVAKEAAAATKPATVKPGEEKTCATEASSTTEAKEKIAKMREKIAASGKGYISNYSIVCEKIEAKKI